MSKLSIVSGKKLYLIIWFVLGGASCTDTSEVNRNETPIYTQSPSEETETQVAPSKRKETLTPDFEDLERTLIERLKNRNSQPVKEFAPDLSDLSLLQTIDIDGIIYKLARTKVLTATFSVLYTYLSSTKKVDVYQSTPVLEDGFIGTQFLDVETSIFLAALPSFVSHGMYESAYPETSKEIYIDLEQQRVSARRVIARLINSEGQLRSLYVIAILDEAEFITFRHTTPINQFDEDEINTFISEWLSKRVNIRSSSSRIISDVNPSLTSETLNVSEVFPKEEREYLRKELSSLFGKELGYFRIDNNHASLNIIPELVEDEDLVYITLAHELSHAAYITENDMDRIISDISDEYGLTLTVNHYQTWGKYELSADLDTMSLLASLHLTLAIKKYIVLRGLPEEIFAPFLRASIQIEDE